jgi:uncharacterized membrane protein
MRTFSKTFLIEAAPSRVWQVMSDLQRWPEWTASVSSVEMKSSGPIGVGTSVVVRQPKLPAATWTITAFEPSAGFTWISRAPGVVVSARHVIEEVLGGTKVTLSICYAGLFGALLATMTASLNERYLAMEAAGLRERSESTSAT